MGENGWIWPMLLLGGGYLVNAVLSVMIIFFERRNPRSVWAWLLLLFLLPGVGFVIYLLLGVDMHKRKLFHSKALEDNLKEVLKIQEITLEGEEQDLPGEVADYMDLIRYNLKADALLFDRNDVDIFVDGNEKFNALLEDLEQAEHLIHLQYYIIRNDVLFHRLVPILEKKAAQGVAVRVLFDGMGCRSVNPNCWKELRSKGIAVAEFFPAFLGRLQLRMNYRNHRKIVVIDNRVAYVGGFNIGKEYIGLEEKFGYWRDTHLRIRGEAVLGLQFRFILDWNYAAKENLFSDIRALKGLKPGMRDDCKIQIISSGPDNIHRQIRDNYLRLITKAKERICIQTPYFVPDESVLNALLIAARSGIEVNLMIPCKPDHAFVYWVTYSYAGELLMEGANCYIYNNGFLHSKGIIVDGEVFCYGTANMDIRSFGLNFEVNAVVYNQKKALEMEGYFREDLKVCTRLTKDMYAARSLKIRFKEQACRLLSPLL